MLVFENGKYIIDANYLNIIPFNNIWKSDSSKNKEIALAKLMWIYHMYNPHSPFRDYRNAIKSKAIVEATFPTWYIKEKETLLKNKIAEANKKNKDSAKEMKSLEESNKPDDDGAQVKSDNKKIKLVFVPTLKLYEPEDDESLEEAIEWYKSHLRQTPLWTAYESYKEAIYNLSKIVADPQTGASDIKTASNELNTLPKKMEDMRQQAVRDEANLMQIAGDKNIKRGEMLPAEMQRKHKSKN